MQLENPDRMLPCRGEVWGELDVHFWQVITSSYQPRWDALGRFLERSGNASSVCVSPLPALLGWFMTC